MIGSLTSQNGTAQLTRAFGRMDADASGAVSRDEFVAGRAQGSSESQAGALFDALDSSGSGAMSAADLATAFQQMTSVLQATLLQAQENRPDPRQAFSDMDSDGDGTLTKEEFVAARPDDASTEQAEREWSRIAGDAQSLTERQFGDNLKQAGPPPSAAA